MAWQTRLIRARCPSGILLVWGDRNQARIGWECALATLGQGLLLRASGVKVVVVMVMVMSPGMSEMFQIMAVAVHRSARSREEKGSADGCL
jgi:hypothetical protein